MGTSQDTKSIGTLIESVCIQTLGFKTIKKGKVYYINVDTLHGDGYNWFVDVYKSGNVIIGIIEMDYIGCFNLCCFKSCN